MEIQREDGTVIVLLPRRFDSDSAPDAEREIRTILADGPERLLFDLSSTDYVSSAGVRVLLSAAHAQKERHREIALCSLNRQVQYVFEITRLNQVFPIYEDRKRALKKMGGKA